MNIMADDGVSSNKKVTVKKHTLHVVCGHSMCYRSSVYLSHLWCVSSS